MIDGLDTPVSSGDPIQHGSEIITPKSRTFIPSRVTDNPILLATGYMSQLQALPEPLRSQMLNGDFRAGLGDDPWQMLPTEWVRAAQNRWTQKEHPGPMDSIGIDPSRGGKDETVISRRHGRWFDTLLCYPGQTVPDGPAAAALVFSAVRDGAPIHVDIIGIGSSVFDHLAGNHLHAVAVNSSEKSDETDRTGKLRFRNKRAEIYWKFREMLDPLHGENVALPPDNQLRADLCAPRWKLSASGIQVESKQDLEKRIGRSPDRGDAVVYAAIATGKKGGAFAPRRDISARRSR